MPPTGKLTPAMLSKYEMDRYIASASYGDSPAYKAWKEKTRRNRGSLKNRATTGAIRRIPPIATRRASAGVASDSGESRLRSMKCRRSTSNNRETYAANRR